MGPWSDSVVMVDHDTQVGGWIPEKLTRTASVRQSQQRQLRRSKTTRGRPTWALGRANAWAPVMGRRLMNLIRS